MGLRNCLHTEKEHQANVDKSINWYRLVCDNRFLYILLYPRVIEIKAAQNCGHWRGLLCRKPVDTVVYQTLPWGGGEQEFATWMGPYM